jgi:hypothetical protein
VCPSKLRYVGGTRQLREVEGAMGDLRLIFDTSAPPREAGKRGGRREMYPALILSSTRGERNVAPGVTATR